MSNGDSIPFALVDVFARTPLSGNPLAVVGAADRLDEARMRAIAREFNQSETTFVLSATRDEANWRLRSFTPAGVEVGGAGHNALGAWWWLADSGRLELAQGSFEFAQEIGGRVLDVRVNAVDGRPRSIAMEQEAPRWGAEATDPEDLAAALGLDPLELGADLPTQVVSTGVGHLLVQARDRAAIDRARPRPDRLAAALRAVRGEGCYLYSLDPADAESDARARFFNPTVGIAEDPATGTAAGPLAAHLVRHAIRADGSTVRIEQGHATGRPSEIEIAVQGRRITISATCVVAAQGSLDI